MATERNTSLRNEYQVCQASVQSLEATVWQSATALGLVSIATLAVAATSHISIPAIALLGVFSTAGAVLWWRLAVRWWSILHAKLRRMLHIEQDLAVAGQSHYIVFLNELHADGSSAPRPQDPRLPALAKKHSVPPDRALDLAHLSYDRKGPREILWAVPVVTAVIWILFFAFQVIPVIWKTFSVFFVTIP